jgi:hypothetical protein
LARHYTTKDFFRQVPNALLARYFQARGLFGDLNFATMKETQPDELFAACLDQARPASITRTRCPTLIETRTCFDARGAFGWGDTSKEPSQ